MNRGFPAVRTAEYALAGRGDRHRSNQLVVSGGGEVLAAALSSQLLFFLRRDLELPAARRPPRAHEVHAPVNYACLLRPLGRECFCFATGDDRVLFFELRGLTEGGEPHCSTLDNRRAPLPTEDFGGTWSLAHLPAREWLLAGSNLRRVNVYEFGRAGEGVALTFLKAIEHADNVPFISVSPCGQFFATACIDSAVSVFGGEGLLAQYEMGGPAWSVNWLRRRGQPRRLGDYALLVSTAASIDRLGCEDGPPPSLRLRESFALRSAWNSRVYLHVHLPERSLLLYYLHASATLLLMRYDGDRVVAFGDVLGVGAGLVGLQALPAGDSLLLLALYETGSCCGYRLNLS